MSSTANWSYTNIATVWPLVKEADGWTGAGPEYGEPYLINCTWVGSNERMAGNDGLEFVPRYKFYHEDDRPRYGDLIARGEQTDQLKGDIIRNHTEYDMSFFEEETDYMSVV